MDDQNVAMATVENNEVDKPTADYSKIIVGLRKSLAESWLEIAKMQRMKERILATMEAQVIQSSDSVSISAAKRLVHVQHLLKSSDAHDDGHVFDRCVTALRVCGGRTFTSLEDVHNVQGLLPAVLRILYTLGGTPMDEFASELGVDAHDTHIAGAVDDAALACANTLSLWSHENTEAKPQDLQLAVQHMEDRQYKRKLEDIKITEEKLSSSASQDAEEEFNIVLQENARVLEMAVRKSFTDRTKPPTKDMTTKLSFLLLKDIQKRQKELVSAMSETNARKQERQLSSRDFVSPIPEFTNDGKQGAIKENKTRFLSQSPNSFHEPPGLKEPVFQNGHQKIETITEFYDKSSKDLGESSQLSALVTKQTPKSCESPKQQTASERQVEDSDLRQNNDGIHGHANSNGNVGSCQEQMNQHSYVKPKPFPRSTNLRADYQRSTSVIGNVSNHASQACDFRASLCEGHEEKRRVFRARSLEFLHRKRLPLHLDGKVEQMRHRFEQEKRGDKQ